MSERKSGRLESAAAVQQKAKQGAVIYFGPPIAGLAMPGTVYQNAVSYTHKTLPTTPYV